MAKTDTLHIRVEPEVKKGVEATLSQLGLSTTEAINIFLRQVVLIGGLPFDVKLPRYNAVTEAAIQEARDMINGKTVSTPHHVDDLFKEMGIDVDG